MSFLKIKDPSKREKTIKDFVALKKRIRDSNLAERTGDIYLQQDLSKFFTPVVQSQEKASSYDALGKMLLSKQNRKLAEEGIAKSEELTGKVLEKLEETSDPERIGNILRKYLEEHRSYPGEERERPYPGEVRPVVIPKELTVKMEEEKPIYELDVGGKKPITFKTEEGKKNFEKIYNFVKVFNLKLPKNKYDFENVFRPVFNSVSGKINFGKHEIMYNPENETLSLGGKDYKATDGLWGLILTKNPGKYSQDDLKNYRYMIHSSDIIFKDNGEIKNYNFVGDKWNKIIHPIYKGEGISFLPSDPNSLLERLDLLLASRKAGNTGLRNEIVSICDELKRQRILKLKSYKNLMTIL